MSVWSAFANTPKIRITPTGLHYQFFKKNNSHRKAKTGDIIFYQLILANSKDSVVLDTKKEFGEQQITVSKSTFKGDLMEGLNLVHIDDSVLFLIPVDSLYKNNLPYFAQPNSYMKFYIKINNVQSEAEFNLSQAEAKQRSLDFDDSLLHIYLNRNFCVPDKLPCGVYVQTKNKNEKLLGKAIETGDTISVNYTGELINHHIFDSNVDKAFNHVEPFRFVVGKGEVIKGWDEAFKTLRYGSKATLFIPSVMAYGKNQVGTIPANSILIFTVEVLKK